MTLRARLAPLRRFLTSPPVKVAFSAAMFVAAVWLIHRELKGWSLAAFISVLRQTSLVVIAASIAMTLASYACLAVTEWYALRCLGHGLDWRRTGAVAFASYAFSNSLGFSLATGTAMRLRLYSSWGLTAAAIAVVALLAGTAVTLSGVVTAGLVLLPFPALFAAAFSAPVWLVQTAGVLLLTPAVLWFVIFRRHDGVLRGAAVHPPTTQGRAFALTAGVADWVLSGAALYILLPEHGLAGFPGFLAVFILGSLISAASGVPGGMGVFEAVVIGLTTLLAKVHETTAALVLYRVIYSLGPLAITGAGLAAHRLIRLRPAGRSA